MELTLSLVRIVAGMWLRVEILCVQKRFVDELLVDNFVGESGLRNVMALWRFRSVVAF